MGMWNGRMSDTPSVREPCQAMQKWRNVYTSMSRSVSDELLRVPAHTCLCFVVGFGGRCMIVSRWARKGCGMLLLVAQGCPSDWACFLLLPWLAAARKPRCGEAFVCERGGERLICGRSSPIGTCRMLDGSCILRLRFVGTAHLQPLALYHTVGEASVVASSSGHAGMPSGLEDSTALCHPCLYVELVRCP